MKSQYSIQLNTICIASLLNGGKLSLYATFGNGMGSVDKSGCPSNIVDRLCHWIGLMHVDWALGTEH